MGNFINWIMGNPNSTSYKINKPTASREINNAYTKMVHKLDHTIRAIKISNMTQPRGGTRKKRNR
jgi:hypothetical protein